MSRVRFPVDAESLTRPENIMLLNDIIAQLEYILPALNRYIGQVVPKDNFLREGMLAYANGVDWNPTGSKGLHVYNGSAWVNLNTDTDTDTDTGHLYVDRGDPAADDLTAGAMITDGAWHDWSLSAIVSTGAVAVCLSVNIEDDAAGSYILFRENGNVNTANQPVVRTQVANVPNDMYMIVACDANRVIEYKASNVTFTTIGICVTGWFVPV